MNTLKVALLWTQDDFQNTVIFNLLKIISKKKIIIVNPQDADFIIFGSYFANSRIYFVYKFLRYFIKNKKILTLINNHQKQLINSFFLPRTHKPITLFYNQEVLDYSYIEANYYISLHRGIKSENHLSFNLLKEDIDWTDNGLARTSGSIMFRRYGNFLDQKKLLIPQGNQFLKKKKEMLFVINNLTEPRKNMYEIFSKEFKFQTFGNAFSNSKDIKISELLKKFAFSFCPEHYCIPGFAGSRVAYAFHEKSLPITFLNQSANDHFNKKAFINLNDHFHDNFEEILSNLKSDTYLKKFSNEPLLYKKLNLNNEIKFIEKILNSF